jgi:hypothetical protein
MPPTHEAWANFDEIAIDELVEIASSAGVTVDREAARNWLRAVADAVAIPGEFARSSDGEFGGHELALIDFDPDVAARLRVIGRLIAMPESPHVVAALAIAGSTAQGLIQPFPADADFFERVHLSAPDRPTAATRLVEALTANLDASGSHAALLLDEIFLGHHDGQPLIWQADEIARGYLHYRNPTGEVTEITLAEAANDPGFVKIDWTLVDPGLGGPGKVSKAIDVTWQSPDGPIESLDGSIDADYQQIYLDASAADLAAALVSGLTAGSRDHYLWHMEREIAKYCVPSSADFAKVAKRLYNYCRLTGRFTDAVYIRELFDEPAARMHQLRLKLEMTRLLTDAERMDAATALWTLADLPQPWCDNDDRVCLRQWADQLRANTLGARTENVSESARAIVSSAFERALRAYTPISQLIDEIHARHPDARARTY